MGLAAGDLLRVGIRPTGSPTLDDGNGIVTLQDPLEAPALAGSHRHPDRALESFDLRNLQTHTLYIGHAELLDLAAARRASPSSSRRALARRADPARRRVSRSTARTRATASPTGTRWTCSARSGSTLRLAKTAAGSVDKVEIAGHKSRWLRAGSGDRCLGPAQRHRGGVCRVVPRRGLPLAAGGDPAPAEGSRTVTRALHNGTPLATTRRFYPFGPEPLRFDVFALAAPEALSKRAAEVSLQVTMVDSSLASLEIATGAASQAGAGMLAGPPGTAPGRNGDLQVLVFGDD